MSSRPQRALRNQFVRRKALALAIGGIVALTFAGGAFAQAVNGTIQGTVPVAPGETVQIINSSGFNRTITVGPSGTYSSVVPVGVYTVRLLQNGKVLHTRTDISPAAGGVSTVDFESSAKNVQTLSAVQVTSAAIPPIDVSSTSVVTTITASQLKALPLGRTAANIAMLSPGVQEAGSLLQLSNPTPFGEPTLSFNGASDAENAYYIDGFNTTNELTGQGGLSLPYFAIEQQQTMTAGYGAKFGRSIGGVISQIGKSGSNSWHFGFRGIWQPQALQANEVNQFWGNPASTTVGQELGDLRTYRRNDNGLIANGQTGAQVLAGENKTFDAYVSGPIIPNKLTFFLGVEKSRTSADTTGPMSNPKRTFATAHQPKIYAKINWNINENNIFTLTGLQVQNKVWESQDNFSYNTHIDTGFSGLNPTVKNTARVWVANYTSFITDNLTLHAMFGKEHEEFFTAQPSFPGFNSDLPSILSASNQNPALLPPHSPGISNTNTTLNLGNAAHKASVTNYRVSLDYKWHNNDFSIGIDNITTWDMGDGQIMSGPGYAWQYGKSDPNKAITGNINAPGVAPFVGAPSANGMPGNQYYVAKYVFENAASVRVAQRAEYIADRWQITPNFLLNLGIRNGTFTNYNPAGVPYVSETKPNWQPRIGFSWNVLGNSTLKVFGNFGRYYIAMPAGVALRGSGASTFTRVYGTYTGVNPANGEPIGFKTLPMNNGGHGPVDTVGVSANNEYGEPLNPLAVAANNVRPEYQDNFVLGAKWEFTPGYVAGITGTYMKLGRILDDWDDQPRMCDAAIAAGLSYINSDNCTAFTQGSVLINPGGTESLNILTPQGTFKQVNVSSKQQGWKRGPKRNYYALDLSLEHPFNGKWFGRADLVYSRLYGNTGGPVDNTIGQGGDSVVISEQWDFAQLMDYSDGVLQNNSKWQLKLYGAYQVNPEWTVGANLFIASGQPKVCLGFFGPQQTDPIGYAQGFGGAYHYCLGHPAPPGSTGYTPWTHQIALNVNYSPKFADHRLNFNLAVFNVLNEQKPLQYYYGPGTSKTPFTFYNTAEAWEMPRSVRFEVSYDF
ncbi:MAG TPA: TonB-dependent receptor [Rhodanobacteraceae bacterium]